MEAVRERKAARQQRSGETSRGNDATQLIDEEGETVSVVIDKINAGSKGLISSSLKKKFKSLDEALDGVRIEEAKNSKPKELKIRKIPFMLRDNDNFKKYLEPRVVSIGPFHAKNSNLRVTHEIKLKLAALFIEKSGINRNELYKRIVEKIADFRKCYASDNNIEIFKTKKKNKKKNNIEELAWMFLVDGCALLRFMIICGSDRKKDRDDMLKSLKIKKDHMAFVQQDVFVLENQLPYELLELLQGLSKKKEDLEHLLEKFILNSIHAPWDLYVANRKNYQKLKERKPFHLLDLLRTTLIQPIAQETDSFRERSCEKLKGFLGKNVFDPFKKLTYPLIKKLFDPFKKLTDPLIKKLFDPCKKKHEEHSSFRNIDELKAAGIRLKPGKTSSMRGISFSCWGTLRIPQIIVDDWTEAKLRNLAAYEMCFQNDYEVSAYIIFMDWMIDRAQDVKALRESGILHNALGSDEEVADLFNRIGKDLVPNHRLYSEVQRIQKHYEDNKWKIWIGKLIAEFIDRYFHSPWSMIAFIAAISALALTIVQTVYTVEAYNKCP